MKKVTINIGFITNSSSVVHWFPRELLEDSEVKAFLSSYEIEDGYVGSNLWNRGECGSFITSREQRLGMNAKMRFDSDIYGPMSDPESDDLVVIYGDEYKNLSSILCTILDEACVRLGLRKQGGTSYN